MTDRQRLWEIEKKTYNAALKTKVVQYLGCTIKYENPAGYGYFTINTPFDSYINHEQYGSVAEAKKAIKRVSDKMNGKF